MIKLCKNYPWNKIIWKKTSAYEYITKTDRLKDQNKNEFHIILPTKKTNVNRILNEMKWNFISDLL